MPPSSDTDRPSVPRIRVARVADLEALVVLSKLLGLDGHDADPGYAAAPDPDRSERFRRSLGRPHPESWVADDEGVVGFVQVHRTSRRTAVVQELYVMPPYRRLGVGRALVGEVTRAYAGSELTVGTLAQDARAVGFWSAMGFAPYWLTLRRRRG